MGVRGPRRPVRVLIADDHPLFAKTIEAVLAGYPGIEVVGVARDGREAVRLAFELAPDLVLMDLEMPLMDGFEATQRIRSLDLPTGVLILTASQSPADADRALELGALGYLTKDRIASELHTAILELAARREPAPKSAAKLALARGRARG